MSKFTTEHFIMEKVAVEDENTSRVFGKPQPQDVFVPAEGRIILIGLPGSGRAELAERLAGRLGMQVRMPESIASASELDALCDESGIIVVVPCEALRNEEVRTALREKGSVFYLMAEVLRMAYRLNQNSEQEREALSALFVEMEPLCMMTLHFILQAWKEPEEIVGNVLEMLGLPA